MTSRCGVRAFAFTDGVIVWRLYLCRKHVQYEQRLSEQFLSTSSHSSNSISEAGLKSQTKYFTLIVFIGPLCSVDISSHRMLLIVSFDQLSFLLYSMCSVCCLVISYNVVQCGGGGGVESFEIHVL